MLISISLQIFQLLQKYIFIEQFETQNNLLSLNIWEPLTIYLQITIRNMVDMLVMSDMYKAPELKAATKKLIVQNSRELMKQRDWKQKFGGSSHLVFEILESVITKDDAA